MMTKDRALEILHKNMQSPNLRKHCYAVGIALCGIYDYLAEHKMLEADAPPKEVWEVLGILHDADYEITKEDWTRHTILELEWLKEEGINESDPLYKAIESHNNKITHLREPQTQMEWALECCDELTGFIVACSLVKPDKKVETVDLTSMKKKWKEKSFAKGVIREQTEQVEEKLNIPLDEFMQIVLDSMKANHESLGI
jgi:predicted hydrolase (HD superfamily)